MYSSRSIALLSEEQQAMLPHMGTAAAQDIRNFIGSNFSPADMAAGKQIATNILQRMTVSGMITPAEASALQAMGQKLGGLSGIGDALAQKIDAAGQSLADAFNTNTHHMFMASAMLTQPLYMGGAITAANNMADIGEKISETGIEKAEQEIIYNIDNTYWMVMMKNEAKYGQDFNAGYLSLLDSITADDIRQFVATYIVTDNRLSLTMTPATE